MVSRRYLAGFYALTASAALVCGCAVRAAPSTVSPVGEWINPARSVRVRTGPCGDRLCGWVSWASDAARADARDGGTPQLIGRTLLDDYRRTGPASWQGRVFVPDWNREFFSRIEQLGADRLKISGCVFGGLLCKSQIWTRG